MANCFNGSWQVSLHSLVLVVWVAGSAACQDAVPEPTENSLTLRMGETEGVFRRVSPSRYRLDYPDFWFLETEVTNRMYREYLRATGGKKDDAEVLRIVQEREQSRIFSTGGIPYWIGDEKTIWRENDFPEGRGEHPVGLVTLYEAQDFCEWLNKSHPDRGRFRLPTWNEWMIAAYGDSRKYPWGDEWDIARAHDSYGRQAAAIRDAAAKQGKAELNPVEIFELRLDVARHETESVKARPDGRTPEGLYGMRGNVSEYLAREDPLGGEYFNLGARWMGGGYNDGYKLSQNEPDVPRLRQDYFGYSHHASMRKDDVGFRVLLDPTSNPELLKRPRLFQQLDNNWRTVPQSGE